MRIVYTFCFLFISLAMFGDQTITGNVAGNAAATTGTECNGETFTITASCDDCTGAVSHQWQVKNFSGSFVDISDGGTISGATTAVIQFTNPTFAGETFRCLFNDCTNCVNGTSDSQEITVTVNENPTSPSVSGAGTFCEGDNDVLTVSFTGGTGVTYSWTKNGSEVGTSSTYSGSNSNTWADGDDDSAYSCTVKSTGCDAGVSASNVAVTVNAQPSSVAITANPGSGDYCSGQNLDLTATPTGGSGTLTYQWKKDGTNASGTSTNSTYVEASSAAIAGNYTVDVNTNGCEGNAPVTSSSQTVSHFVNATITSISDELIPDQGMATFTVTCNNVETSSNYTWNLGSGTETITNTIATASASGSFTFAGNTLNYTVTNTSLNAPTNTIYTSKIDITDATAANSFNMPVSFTVDNNDVCDAAGGDATFSTAAALLPIELTEFKATPIERNILVEWSTESEINSDYFVVQRAYDDGNFEELGKVKAAGFSNEPISYSFIDENAITKSLGNYIFYRLKEVDQDGAVWFSDIIEVEVERGEQLGITSLSVGADEIEVFFTAGNEQNVELSIINVNGQVLMQKQPLTQEGLNQEGINVSHMPQGLYILQLTDGQQVISKKFFK